MVPLLKNCLRVYIALYGNSSREGPESAKNQNTGRGQCVRIHSHHYTFMKRPRSDEQHYFSIHLYFIFLIKWTLALNWLGPLPFLDWKSFWFNQFNLKWSFAGSWYIVLRFCKAWKNALLRAVRDVNLEHLIVKIILHLEVTKLRYWSGGLSRGCVRGTSGGSPTVLMEW